MNIFNRIVVILLLLAAFVVLTIVLVVPDPSLRVVKGVVDGSLNTMERILDIYVIPFHALLILCAALLDILFVGLLILEVRGPTRRTIRVQKVGGGVVELTAESLVERLQYHVDQLADVINVKVKVTPRRGGVDVDLNVQTGADVNVPEKAEQVLETTRQVVEDKMGLKLARKPRVYIHTVPYPGVVARPKPGAPIATAPPAPGVERALTPSAPPAESLSFHREGE